MSFVIYLEFLGKYTVDLRNRALNHYFQLDKELIYYIKKLLLLTIQHEHYYTELVQNNRKIPVNNELIYQFGIIDLFLENHKSLPYLILIDPAALVERYLMQKQKIKFVYEHFTKNDKTCENVEKCLVEG
jgi:hypothetical protein